MHLWLRDTILIATQYMHFIGLSCKMCFLNLQTNRSQKLSMLQLFTRTVLVSALNSAQSYEARFSIFCPQIFFIAGQIKKKISIFGKKYFSVGRSLTMRTIRLKLEIWLYNFVRNSMQIPNLSLFLF